MGRPKGSKNRAKVETPSEPGFPRVRMVLTDEDLAPARNRKAAHARAADDFVSKAISGELAQQRIGEIEYLSVPQVVPFDLSGAFVKIAEQKARAAGFLYIENLKKSAEGWIFDAHNEPRKSVYEEADQS